MLAFRVVLNPKIKLSMLEYLYGKVESDLIKWQEKMSLERTELYKIFSIILMLMSQVLNNHNILHLSLHQHLHKVVEELKVRPKEFYGVIVLTLSFFLSFFVNSICLICLYISKFLILGN